VGLQLGSFDNKALCNKELWLIICLFSKVLVAGGVGFIGSRLFDDDSVCVAVMCLLCSARWNALHVLKSARIFGV
jgi:hypothetical protein